MWLTVSLQDCKKILLWVCNLPAISGSSPCICPCMLLTFICVLIFQNSSDIGFIPAVWSSSLFLSEFYMQTLGCYVHHVQCLVYLDASFLYLISQFPVSLYFFWSCSPVWFHQILKISLTMNFSYCLVINYQYLLWRFFLLK